MWPCVSLVCCSLNNTPVPAFKLFIYILFYKKIENRATFVAGWEDFDFVFHDLTFQTYTNIKCFFPSTNNHIKKSFFQHNLEHFTYIWELTGVPHLLIWVILVVFPVVKVNAQPAQLWKKKKKELNFKPTRFGIPQLWLIL